MNTSAQDNTKKTQSTGSSSQPVLQGSTSKERVGIAISTSSEIQPLPTEFSPSVEVESAGVKVSSDQIEIPPDLQNLGVRHSGSNVPTQSSSQVSTVVLPLSDDQVLKGLHAPIISAFRWLSIWCMRQLKKAHLVIKNVHGKMTRVPIP